MLKANYQKYILHFKQPSGTSRGILTTKETWFLMLKYHENWGIGECGMLRGLSIDDRPDYEAKLQWVCENINLGKEI
ncbi:MAG: o-succinylbenzoate synthase, partial [Flavobacteriaceae bacterium]|nr:o-succinylbenzoate synthase [Flavobacteriaceae bacterium]